MEESCQNLPFSASFSQKTQIRRVFRPHYHFFRFFGLISQPKFPIALGLLSLFSSCRSHFTSTRADFVLFFQIFFVNSQEIYKNTDFYYNRSQKARKIGEKCITGSPFRVFLSKLPAAQAFFPRKWSLYSMKFCKID